MAATELPNPNSAIDGVRLADGRFLLAANPVRKGRTPLVLLVSTDGRRWRQCRIIEDDPGEFSYPSLIVGADGRVHLVYTWRRQRIACLTLEPGELS